MVYYLSSASVSDSDVGFDLPKDWWEKVDYLDPDSVPENEKRPTADRREAGFRVRPDTLPSQITLRTKADPIPDVLAHFVVSQRFRDLVEQFEPGVHQFVPVDVYAPDGREPVATYYWFIVGQRLDSVDRQHTTYMWEEGTRNIWVDSIMNTNTWEFTKISGAKLVFSNKQVSGHHIWHDPHVLTFGNGLCSDAFGKAALAAGLTGLAVTPRDSV
jgi:hypothetical protein